MYSASIDQQRCHKSMQYLHICALHASSVTAVFSAQCKKSEGDVPFVTHPDFMYELNPGPYLLGLRT